jgi:hypothetical protein
LKRVAVAASLLSYALCVASPLLYFFDRIDVDAYKTLLAVGTVGWLVFATVWSGQRDTT